MFESSHDAGNGPSQRALEIGVALTTLCFGLLFMYGSWLVGITWAIEGPRAGFFPFYISLLIVIGSAVNLARAIAASSVPIFAEWSQLWRVATVLVPSIVYVVLIPRVGIYVSSALLIGLFMKWIGRYGWPLTLIVAIGLPVLVFVVFERWFLIPLPKGPIEDWLGY